MSKVNLTNYELNQQAYRNLPQYTEEQLDRACQVMKIKLEESPSSIEYLGILCRERHDYTLIHINNSHYEAAIDEMIEVLQNRGDIMDIIYDKKSGCYQAWVREKGAEVSKIVSLMRDNYEYIPEVWMYMIFDASDWVIETE